MQRFQLITAYNGSEALAILERRKPDLILLDLNLPDIPGDHLIRKIRSNKFWTNLPIIVLTGEDLTNEAELLKGIVKIVKPNGMNNNEIVDLIQYFVDTYPEKEAAAV